MRDRNDVHLARPMVCEPAIPFAAYIHGEVLFEFPILFYPHFSHVSNEIKLEIVLYFLGFY